MPLVTPFWFGQRQAKAEEAGPNAYRLFGPNLPESFVSIRRAENGKWLAAWRLQADGADQKITEPVFDTEYDAWEAAFELYRTEVIV